MKNLATVVLVLFMVISFSACKKDWTCECLSGTSNAYNTTIKKMRKNDAKSICEDYGKVAAPCVLK